MSSQVSATLLPAFALSFLASISNAYVIPAYDEQLTKRDGVPTIDESKVKAGLIHGFVLYGGITVGAMAAFSLAVYLVSHYFGKKTEAAKRRVAERQAAGAAQFRARDVNFEMMPMPEPTRPTPAVLNNSPRRSTVLDIIPRNSTET